jgi:hypothetical protein
VDQIPKLTQKRLPHTFDDRLESEETMSVSLLSQTVTSQGTPYHVTEITFPYLFQGM